MTSSLSHRPAPSARVWHVVLTPLCRVLDDRVCDCGQHSTYTFAGIPARSGAGAAIIAADIVGASIGLTPTHEITELHTVPTPESE